MSTCGAPMMGGRKRRGTRKMRGGNFYGMGDPIATGIPTWNAVANAGADPVTGAPTPELYGGRRRRTGKKATRKGGRKSRAGRRHARRRTMRGGAGVVNSAGVGYGYTGTGAGGLADATSYASRVGGAPMNPDGVRSA